MDMLRLHPDMTERYEIGLHRPARVNAVQFGMSEALMGTVDRLIDEANAQRDVDRRIGIVCLQAGEAGYAARLDAQGGLYTLIVRGTVGEESVRREQVVQCILRAADPDTDAAAVEAWAKDSGIGLAIVDASPRAKDLFDTFMKLRFDVGLDAPTVLRLCENAEASEDAIAATADSLAFRSTADEAARLCAGMNYLDDMLHLCEPHARVLCAPLGSLKGTPLEGVAGFTDAPAAWTSRRVFDSGLFLLAAAGWLNGCDTLSDCMKHERLRRFAGEGVLKEWMPQMTDDRAALESGAIESFGRYEDAMNDNRILPAAKDLLERFAGAPLKAIERYASENFAPPRRLTFALSATIMLYAGARYNESTGRYEVARGKTVEPLFDDPDKLRVFSTLSHDMPPETLTYAVLADRELWGRDLREIDGLEARVALDIAAMQRDPSFLPEGDE